MCPHRPRKKRKTLHQNEATIEEFVSMKEDIRNLKRQLEVPGGSHVHYHDNRVVSLSPFELFCWELLPSVGPPNRPLKKQCFFEPPM